MVSSRLNQENVETLYSIAEKQLGERINDTDALDKKTAAVLGGVAALLAAGVKIHWFEDTSRIIVGIMWSLSGFASICCGLWGFRSRRYPYLNTIVFRTKYIQDEPTDFRDRLLTQYSVYVEKIAQINRQKNDAMNRALLFGFLCLVLFSVATVLNT